MSSVKRFPGVRRPETITALAVDPDVNLGDDVVALRDDKGNLFGVSRVALAKRMAKAVERG